MLNEKQFSEYLFDKKVLLVGNSTGLLKVNYGKWIDSYDVVVRFNRIYNELPYQFSSLGHKTSILVTARPVERLLLDDRIKKHETIDWLCWSTTEEEMRERCPQIRAKYFSKLVFIDQFARKLYKTQYGVWPTTGYVAFDWFVCKPQVREINLIGFDWFRNPSIVTGLNQSAKWHKPDIEMRTMIKLAEDHHDRIKIWQTKTSTDLETPTLLTA